MGEVDVVFRKYDGRLHRRAIERRLGEDEWGTWLGVPIGTEIEHVSAGISRFEQHRGVRLIPRTGWWTAVFFTPTRELEMYCDITVPAHWSDPALVTLVDLDLDVARTHAGEVELLDEDEFAAHQLSYGYPADVIAQARSAARDVLVASRQRAEPFGAHYVTWLDRV
jgi:protein associated with RNAse G/E